MTVYFVTLFLVVILANLAQKTDFTKSRLDKKGRFIHSKSTRVCFTIAAAVLIFVAGFRFQIGSDFGAYYYKYDLFAKQLPDKIKSLDEPGFSFICWTVVKLGGEGAAVIFSSAALTIFLFLRTIYKNTNQLLLTLALFIFLGIWHGCFNGVRQYLAAAIVFSGIRYIKERRFWKYAFVVFLAFLFHASAILMIFCYFIAGTRVSVKNYFLLAVCSVAVLFSFDKIMSLSAFILNEEYSPTDTYLTAQVNVFRIIVAVIPVVAFAILKWGNINNRDDCTNMNFLMLNAVVFLATSNSTYLARMGIYTAPFVALAIPKLLATLSDYNQKVLRVIIPSAYFLFWWYEISNSRALIPFRFLWQA